MQDPSDSDASYMHPTCMIERSKNELKDPARWPHGGKEPKTE